MMVRKTLYMPGGRGVDKAQLLKFIDFLYENGIDVSDAAVFTEASTIAIEYDCIDTKDIIVPANTYSVMEGDKSIEEGVSSTVHRRGYSIGASYLDIDYGSPDFVELLRNSKKECRELSYNEAVDYAARLWFINLEDIIDRSEFEDIRKAAKNNEKELNSYLDTKGADSKLQELADKITALGMGFGIWVEPEMISENSELYLKTTPSCSITLILLSMIFLLSLKL